MRQWHFLVICSAQIFAIISIVNNLLTWDNLLVFYFKNVALRSIPTIFVVLLYQ